MKRLQYTTTQIRNMDISPFGFACGVLFLLQPDVLRGSYSVVLLEALRVPLGLVLLSLRGARLDAEAARGHATEHLKLAWPHLRERRREAPDLDGTLRVGCREEHGRARSEGNGGNGGRSMEIAPGRRRSRGARASEG